MTGGFSGQLLSSYREISVIYYFTPYSTAGKLGEAYNECCSIVPEDDDWIGLIDCDVMFFSDFGQQIQRVVDTYSFDMYTCWATRIGNPSQQYQGEISKERSLVALKAKYDECAAAHWGKASPILTDVSGHFLLFQKKLWKEFPFPTSTPEGSLLGIDTMWSRRILLNGKRLARLDGLLAIHHYRLGKSLSDKSHLALPQPPSAPADAKPRNQEEDTQIQRVHAIRDDPLSKNASPADCLVIVPMWKEIEPECERGLQALEKLGYVVQRAPVRHSLDDLRNRQATRAMEKGFSETMWIDPDIEFSPQHVEKLRAHRLPIVSAMYPRIGKRGFASRLLPETREVVFGKRGGLLEIRYAAGGFLLVRRAAYELIQQTQQLPVCNEETGAASLPFFLPQVIQEADGRSRYLPDDFSFCERARQAGLPIFTDTTIRLKRFGDYAYTWEDAGRRTDRFSTYKYGLK